MSTTSPAKPVIRERISSIDKVYRADIRFPKPLAGKNTISVRQSDEVMVRVPDFIRYQTEKKRRQLPHNKQQIPIFFSRRFFDAATINAQIAEHIKHILTQHGCHVVEAIPTGNENTTVAQDVESSLWVAHAAILLVSEPPKNGGDAFNVNFAHEFGFFRGQGKPLLALVEEPCYSTLAKWMGFGFQSAPFQRSQYNNSNSDKSVDVAIRNFVNKIRQG